MRYTTFVGVFLLALVCQGSNGSKGVDLKQPQPRGNVKALPVLHSGEPESKSSSYSCGTPVIVDTRIVGGNQSIEGKWPWQALFRVLYSSGGVANACGGSLVHNKWVITAAHCTHGEVASKLAIGLGYFDNVLTGSFSKIFPVARIFDHPDYDDRTTANDISLLKLGGEVLYTDYIIPVCLPTQGINVTVGLSCWITGWGNTESEDEPSNILREASVPIVSNTDCQSWYSTGSSITIETFHVCAGFQAGGVDTCQGDSGGPLACKPDSSSPYQLEGITSFGIGCADENYPGVYARVSEYATWINDTIAGNSEEEAFFALSQTPCGTMISSDQQIRLPVDSETQTYASSLTCNWNLTPADATATSITITFIERISTEPQDVSSCFDSVKIFANTGVTTTQIGSDICGFDLPSAVLIEAGTYEYVTVTFTSDDTVQYAGFAANITFTNATIIAPTTSPDTTTTPTATDEPSTNETPAIASISYPGCGIPSIVDNRIVGGTTAIAGKWPWQAGLKGTDSSSGAQGVICGGTLLNRKWVVTAAHCTVRYSAVYLHVLLGTFDYAGSFESFAREFPVSKIVNHLAYNSASYENDISMLKLGGTATMSDYILPSCLPVQGVQVQVGLSCSITGWGNTEVSTDDQSVLREATVPILSNAVCSSWYGGQLSYGIFDVHVCAGFQEGGVDTCQGDSGGPLACQSNSSEPYLLQGITSFGIGCADASKPGVYTRVSQYVEWMEESMNSNPGTESFFALPQTPCNSVISTNQILRLPVNNETQIYESMTECSWTLNTNGLGVIFEFVERFSVEAGSDCWDYVQITANGNILSHLCGYTLPNQVIVQPNTYDTIEIKFTSDSTINFDGFAVSVTFSSTVPAPTSVSDGSVSLHSLNSFFLSLCACASLFQIL